MADTFIINYQQAKGLPIYQKEVPVNEAQQRATVVRKLLNESAYWQKRFDALDLHPRRRPPSNAASARPVRLRSCCGPSAGVFQDCADRSRYATVLPLRPRRQGNTGLPRCKSEQPCAASHRWGGTSGCPQRWA